MPDTAGAVVPVGGAMTDTAAPMNFVMVNGQPMSMEDYNQTQQAPPTSLLDTAKDLGAGFAKAAGRTVQFVGDTVPHAFGGAGLSDYVDMATGRPEGTSEQMARSGLESKNTTQTVGGLGETALEMGLPIGAAAEAMPSATRAGAKFAEVSKVAGKLPVDLSKPGDIALRIVDLAQHGGGTEWGPAPVRQFVKWATDPNRGPMTYDVARDFASNINKLSVKETLKISNPNIFREVANLRVALNKANAEVAAKVGKGAEYAQAMNEYAKAMKIRNAMDVAIDAAKKSAVVGAVGATGYGLYHKLSDIWGGG